MDIDKISILFDRLSIINVKIAILEHRKRDERNKKRPDLKYIDSVQRQIDILNQERFLIKNAIDRKLRDIIAAGKYEPLLEERTYRSSDIKQS